jgi:hypothetical protein
LRKAQNLTELESILTATALHTLNYYHKRPIKRLLVRLGIVNGDVSIQSSSIALKELADVNFDFEAWYEKYGKKLKG